MRLVPSEREQALDAIAAQIETFWLTDIVRDHRPTVQDEIRHGLGMVCDTLFEIVPQVYRGLEGALSRNYEWTSPVPPSCDSAPGSAGTATAIRTSRTMSPAMPFACTRKQSCGTTSPRLPSWGGG